MPKDIRQRIANNFAGRNTNAQHSLHANLQRQLEAAKTGFTVEAFFDPLLTGGDPAAVVLEAERIRRSEAFADMSPAERFYAHGLLYMGWSERPTVPGTEEPNRFAYRGLSTGLYTKLVLALGLQHELVQTLIVSLAGVLEEEKCVENIATAIEKVLQSIEEKEQFDSLWGALSHNFLKEGTPERIKGVLLDQKRRFDPDFSFSSMHKEEIEETFQDFQDEECTRPNDLTKILNTSTDKLEVLCEITDKGLPGVLHAHEECDTEDFLFVAANKSNRALLDFISTPDCTSDLDKWMTRVLSLSKRLEEADDLVRVIKAFAENVLPHTNTSPSCGEALKETFLRLFDNLSSSERADFLHFLREKNIKFTINTTNTCVSEVSLFNRAFEGCTDDEGFVSVLQRASLSSSATVLNRVLQMGSEDKAKVPLTLSFLGLLGYGGTDYAVDTLIDSAPKPSSALLAALVDSNFGTTEHAISKTMEKQEWSELEKIQFLCVFVQRVTTKFQENNLRALSQLVTKISGNTCILCELSLKCETYDLLEAISEKAPSLRVEAENGTFTGWKKEQILGNLFHAELAPPPTKQHKASESSEPTKASFPCWLTKPDDERGPLKTRNMNQFGRVFEFVEGCTLSNELAETLPERLNALRGVPPIPLIIATEAFRRNILLAAACILSRATEKEFERFAKVSLPKLISHELYTPEQFDGISEKFLIDCAVFQSLWLLCTPAVVSQLSPKYFLGSDFFPCVTNMIKHFSKHLVLHAHDDFASALRLACSLYTIPLFRLGTPEATKMRSKNEEQIRILCLNVIKAARDSGGDKLEREGLKDIISGIPDELCRRELEAAVDK